MSFQITGFFFPLYMAKFVFILIFSIFRYVAYPQAVPFRDVTFQQGDLLFVGAKREDLSGAINRVTQRQAHLAFDHVALVEVSDDRIYLIHATGAKGTIREPMQDYLDLRLPERPEMVVFRLKDDYQRCIPGAIDEAKKWLGKPYTWSYVLNDTSIYCSDLVERAFRPCNLFDLEPMTFKNPATNAYDAYWILYYDRLGIPVPEGQLGCNPNGLSASEKLMLVGRIALAADRD